MFVMKSLLEELHNFNSLGNLQVDRENSVIRNVKIIGFESANNRIYTPEALKEAAPLYEGVKVNVDHPEGNPDDQRSAWDRIGFLQNVRFVEGKGLYGDLHLLPSHPFTKRVIDAAENMPQVYGLSHNAKGEGNEDRKSGKFVINKVVEVRHVDIVADPATTQSLAESQQASKQETEEAAYTGVGYKSKKRQPGARRGFTKKKSGDMMKKRTQESDDEEKGLTRSEKGYDKLHARVIDVLKHEGVADHKKADMIVDILNKMSGNNEEGKAMDDEKDEKKIQGEEAVSRDDSDDKSTDDADEAKDYKSDEVDTDEAEGCVCEKCGKKMESCCGEADGEDTMKEAEDEEEKKVDSKESVELERLRRKESLRDLCENSKVKPDKQLIEDLCLVEGEVAERIIKRLANAERLLKPKSAAPVAEKRTGVDALEGKQLFSWLKN